MTGRTSLAGWGWFLVVPALMLALAIAACDGGEGGGGGETPTAEESPAAAETPEEGETPAQETPTGDEDGDGAAELSRLARSTEGITASVTYRFSSTGPGGTVSEGEWTLTQRPPDTRTDYTVDGDQVTVINAGGAAYVCTGSGEDGQCFSVPQAQAGQQTALFAPVFSTTESLAEDTGGFGLVNTTERTIAGVDAKCFEVAATALTAFQSAEVCISEDGILLLSRTTTSAGEFLVEATDVSTDVGDADFEPPFPVTELGQ